MKGIAGIVLAAGASRRLGEPKQRTLVGGEPLLQRAVRVASEAGLNPIYVVVATQGEEEFWLGMLDDCIVLLNTEAAEGMAASIRLGTAAADEAGAPGVVVMACDQPAVSAEHLRKLIAPGVRIVASEYAGRRGVPAYFPANAFPELMKLRGDTGARELLRDASSVELPGGELDVDTIEELDRARKLYS